MVKRLVAFALYQPLFMALVTVLFIGGGIVAFRSLPVEAFPDVTDGVLLLRQEEQQRASN